MRSQGPDPPETRAFGERPALAIYRVLLLMLPRDFRREHGAECAALFRRTLRDAHSATGPAGAVRATWRGWLGVLTAAGEEVRVPLLRGSHREAHHALRRLLRAPGFTTPATLTLALAFGAVTAVFTVARAVVLSPLPYPDADRLIWLNHGSQVLDQPTGLAMTSGFYVQYRERAATLESIAIHQARTLALTGDGEPERVSVVRTTPSLARVLRVSPELGRWFGEGEDGIAGPATAVLSHGFWQRRYGSDPNVVGRTITLSDYPYEIVGVMPPGFGYPERRSPDVWVPLRIDESNTRVSGFNYQGVARLSEGATLADAAAEQERLIAQLPQRFPEDAAGLPFIEEAKVFAAPMFLKAAVVGATGRTLWTLMGAAAVVLLIACANVANLFLVRAEGRQRELAVRSALGAGRAAMPALLLTESTMLSLIGGVLGLALAYGGVELLVAHGPQDLPRLDEVRIDAAVVGFTFGISLLGGLAFGSVPLMRRARLASALNESGRGSTASPGGMRVRHVLMGAQVALSLVLLIASGLLAKSFRHLLEVDPGFSARSVLALGVSAPYASYPTREEAAVFHDRLLQRIRALPGVVSATATTCPPLAGSCWSDPIQVEGRARTDEAIPPLVSRRRVGDEFFETLGIAPIAGRAFETADHRQPTRVAVIDERLAQLYFPGEDPIGQRLWPDWIGESAPDWYEVVGVVPHVVTFGLASADRPAQLYLPLLTHSTGGTPDPHGVDVLVRTTTAPQDLVPAIRHALAELDPGIPLGRITTLEELLEDDRAPMAFIMVLILIAGAAASSLALVGIYGVLAFAVSQRAGEIGVRMAMGARPGEVARMVLRQGAVVASVGLVVGLGAALAASRLLEAALFDVSASDPATYATVAAGLLVVSLLACWIPARRAARLDPVAALRAE